VVGLASLYDINSSVLHVERGIESDFALSLLLQAVRNRRARAKTRDPSLSLILMVGSFELMKYLFKYRVCLQSATISTEKFAAYLSAGTSEFAGEKVLSTVSVRPAPILHIPGFTYPVTQIYKNDFELFIRKQQFEFLRVKNRSVQGGASDPDRTYEDLEEDEFEARRRFNYADFEDWENARKQMQQKRASSHAQTSSADNIDYDLIIQLVCRLGFGNIFNQQSQTADDILESAVGGCVLIFMPGVPEINKCMNLLKSAWDAFCVISNNSMPNNRSPYLKMYPLHGNLSSNEQKSVFTVAARQELKVVISTNVAEVVLTNYVYVVVAKSYYMQASVTLSDVVVVIDTCRVKEMEFDTDTQSSCLLTKFASKDSLRQRAGRAGRVAAGRCFRCVTEQTYEKKLNQHSIPEILRAPLDRLVLQMKATELSQTVNQRHVNDKPLTFTEYQETAMQQSSCWSILVNCIDPPPYMHIQTAIARLQKLQALDADTEMLTPLGKHLSRLPSDPRVARVLVYGVLLGCVFDASCVCALSSVKSPFLSTADISVRYQVDQTKVITGF
jgi:ATP-dependent RNA helicase DHX57